MTDLVPPVDLAPSLPSRVVTVNLIDTTEGEAAEGTVRFTPLGDIHVPADRMIVKARPVDLTLTGGAGQIRLPVGEPIVVKKSWAPHEYLITVPAGGTTIDLSQILPMVEVPAGITDWLITGAGITVTEGATWGASVDVSGGVVTIRLTVPPGATPYWVSSALTGTESLDELATGLTSGRYMVPTPAVAASLSLPVAQPGVLDVASFAPSFGLRQQTFTAIYASPTRPRQWTRTRYSGQPWGQWHESATVPHYRSTITGSDDLDTLGTGIYYVGSPQAALDLGLPAVQPGFVETSSGAGYPTSTAAHAVQTYTALYGDGVSSQWRRSRYLGQSYGDWSPVGSGGGPVEITDRTRFVQPKRYSTVGGPGVVLRFDDGYKNNLELAAPIMADYGFRGTLYTGTHPSEWLGTTVNGAPILTAEQLLELHEVFGWEIGSHTRRHDRWDHWTGAGGQGSGPWWKSVRDGIQDFLDMGLPRPRSFAYPNGQRTKAADRLMYRDFEHIGMIGEPEMCPMPWDQPNLFTGWQELVVNTTDNLTRSLDRIKRYVDSSLSRGENAVLAFHGISAGGPPAPHSWFQDEQTFTALMAWLGSRGIPVITQQETRTHNLVADPSFWDEAPTADGGRFTSYPWAVTPGGWERTARADVGGHQMQLTASSPDSDSVLSQRIAVTPGETYRLHWDIALPALTSGSVDIDIAYCAPRVDVSPTGATSVAVLATQEAVATHATQGAATVTKSIDVTAPSDPEIRVAELRIRANGFQGTAEHRFLALHRKCDLDPFA